MIERAQPLGLVLFLQLLNAPFQGRLLRIVGFHTRQLALQAEVLAPGSVNGAGLLLQPVRQDQPRRIVFGLALMSASKPSTIARSPTEELVLTTGASLSAGQSQHLPHVFFRYIVEQPHLAETRWQHKREALLP